MNFWPRGPFLPAVAAALPFAAIQPHFNNPAWDVPQSVVARPFFAPGVAAINPWVAPLEGQHQPLKIEPESGPSSPWRNKRDSPERRSSSSRREERNRSRSRDRSRRRYSRSRSRSKSRDRRSRDRSNSPRDRWSRDRSRERSSRRGRDDERRDRDSSRRRDRSSSRKRNESDEEKKREREEEKDMKRPKPGDDDKYSLEAANYKTQTPNETIMIRGLVQHITENDIRQEIMKCGLRPKDIRLIRKKETGVSRGFAFVEFNTTEEALCWMELKQGILMLQDLYRAIMQFSIVAGEPGSTAAALPFLADWDCPKCYAHNFKKRVTCYKCLSPRPTADPNHPNSEISPHPTTKIIIRNLDPLATEEDLLKEISAISKTPIQSCVVSRDPLTNLSSGVCYLEMKNVLEAIILYNDLTSRNLTIFDKKVVVCYCKLQRDPPPAAEWPAGQAQAYSLSDVPRLAEYSARLYATNPSQKASLIQYYTQYYTNQINQISSTEGLPKDINSAAAVALSAIQMAQTKKAVLAGAAASAVSAGASLSSQTAASSASSTSYGYLSSQQIIGNTSIGEPDMATYVFEESSGYYYDQKTGLYYDPKTQYYYHSQDQVYLYWDTEKKAYMPAASTTSSSSTGNGASKNEEPKEDRKSKKEDKEKEKEKDKVKVAKRIAKDMERWAKSQNQKKDIARQSQVAVQSAQYAARSAATADIAFDVLERQEVGSYDVHHSSEDQGALVAAYGGGSDSDEAPEEPNYEQHHTDWNKMACLLCKRQFPSKEALQKHNQLSDLHKQNLATWYTSRGMEQPSARSSDPSSLSYRDRAKERRLKFGAPDTPKVNKSKDKYTKIQEPVYDEPNRAGIPAANLGSKMMQKMGWSEGMGLGKMNQGRTDIVHAVQRVSTAGLGVAGSTLGTGTPGMSYKENVKRAAMARFSEMQEREQS